MSLRKTLILFLYFSSNNILFTVTDLRGNTIWQKSTGVTKTRGTRKVSLVSIKIILVTLTKFLSLKDIHIRIRGVSKFKRLVLKFVFKSLNSTILSFYDLTKVPHNGTKNSKSRRV